jgi:hypothetical protein
MGSLAGLDRLDRWLSSRQGKQRAILSWFHVFTLAFYVGMLGWFTWVFFGSPALIVVPVIALAGAVLAAPLRRLAAAMRARRSRWHPDKAGPAFTWRWILVAILFAIEEVLAAVNQSAGQNPPHGHQALPLLQAIIALSTLPVLLTTPRYLRRYHQARLNPPAGSMAFQDPSRHPHPAHPAHQVYPARPPWEAGP